MKTRETEILDELKELAPSIVTILDGHPFSVPENYFEGLPIRISGIIQSKKAAGVPESYFNELPRKVMTRIQNTERRNEEIDIPGGGNIRWLNTPRAAAIAAILAGAIITISIMLMNPNTQIGPVTAIDDISTGDLESYVKWNIQNFQEEKLELMLHEDDQFTIPNEDIDTEDLEDYLKKDIDLTTLEDML